MVQNDEMDAEGDDTDTADMAPHEHIKAAVTKSCHAVLDDDQLSVREKLDKLKRILTSHERMKADSADPDDEDELDDDEMPTKKPDATTEAIALLLRLGKGQRRITEHRRRRPPVPMSDKEFLRRLRHGA